MKKLFDGVVSVLPVPVGGGGCPVKVAMAGRILRMVKHAFRSLLVLSAALIMTFGNEEIKLISPAAESMGFSSLAQAAEPDQCSDVATIAAGGHHTVGLKEDGKVVAVGNNSYGQLNVSSWTNIQAVAAGWHHTVGLQDGSVVAAGNNGYGQLNVSSWTNIKAVAAGAYHTVGLKQDGTVTATGYNGYGQLNVSSWTNIQATAAGWYHTVGLKTDGTVAVAGNNSYGQLNVSSWKDIKALAAGAYHTVGLKADGTVVAAGNNVYGQLDVSSWTNIKALAAGVYHTVGLKEDGTVAVAGNNSYGQLSVSSWKDIKALAAGAYHTLGLKADGSVEAAGYNGYGQLNVTSRFTDIMPICEPACGPGQDTTSPITTAKVNGKLGNNEWYLSDVEMIVTATDNSDGLGVKEIHYSVDGTETIAQGDTAVFSIAGDGTHTVIWYAVDKAGNVEMPPQEMKINIDKTPPAGLSLSASPAVLWPPNRKIIAVMVQGAAADGGSGIASTQITVADEYGNYNLTVPGFGDTIALESWCKGTDKDGRVYTITAVATDKAGNQSTGTTTVIVPHDRRK